MGEIPKVEDNSFIKAIYLCIKLDNLKSEVKMCCHRSTVTWYSMFTSRRLGLTRT